MGEAPKTAEERAQAEAWEKELDVLRQVIGSNLGPDAEPRDIEQAAKGVLLVCTLPPKAFGVALRHIRMEEQRRGKS